MTVKYGKFELPSKIRIDEAVSKKNHTRFIAEPFERGFGHTVGNALRRILLTGMEAPAVISLSIEGVSHEYAAVEGIVEDVINIGLNFKSVLLRKLPTEEEKISRDIHKISKVLEVTSEMLEQSGGNFVVTVGALFGDSNFDVVNSDQLLFTVTKPMTKKIDIKVGFGRGYIPSERHVIKDKGVDEVVIDSIFSPVRLVNYYVENTRVGQDTDFDRLIFDITTDGRISPQEAISFATQIAIFHLQVFDQIKAHSITFDPDEKEKDTDLDSLLTKISTKVDAIELSVRSANCLTSANIEVIGELIVMPEVEMLKFRNFGRKSLTEIKDHLGKMGLSLGMDLASYGITKDNIKEVVAEHLAKKRGASSE
jgi:DNA-directed RNA polymerase subunit alpha